MDIMSPDYYGAWLFLVKRFVGVGLFLPISPKGMAGRPCLNQRVEIVLVSYKVLPLSLSPGPWFNFSAVTTPQLRKTMVDFVIVVLDGVVCFLFVT